MDEVNAIAVWSTSPDAASDTGEDVASNAGDEDDARYTRRLWGLNDICVRVSDECFRLSVLDYWTSAEEMTRDVMPRTTVRRNHPFRPRELILGGTELNDWEVVRAEAAMITMFIHNVNKPLVKRWEAQVRAACYRAHSRENSTIDVQVLTSFSLEESMAEAGTSAHTHS